MKPNNITRTLFTGVSLFSLLFSACTKPSDFGDTNINPYVTTSPVTQNLITGALRSLPGTTNGSTPALYAQHIAEIQYTDESRFLTVNFDYGAFYTGPLLNLNKIIQFNSDPATAAGTLNGGSNANQIAVARILRAYYFFHMTNRWGDIPYTDALKQGDNLTPKFDKQQDIYTALFKELKEAAAQFDGGKVVQGDIFLSGDVNRWKAFAASIRLIMALRLSKADPAKGKAEFLDAKAAGPVTTNAGTFKYAHLAETANQSAWYARYLTRFDFAISKPFLDYLQSVNDPRIPAFADKPTNGNANYIGMPYGLAVTSGIPNTSISYIGIALRRQNSAEYILSAAHVLFSLAEGEKLGWNAGNAANDAQATTYYNEGIKVSMEQYGVYTVTAHATYIAQPDVAYTPADAIKKISYQRWVALYLSGVEAWAEWRRTGFPTLSPGPAPYTPDGQIPRRQAYPVQERDLNLTNYNEVIARQGADILATKMWLDK
jgi:hypothetical protein